MKPFWITFYSYKGGVGRSLSLANTAALLVQKGRRVVLIDFDLEAPGLDSFDEFKSIAGKPGVVEYVSEFFRYEKASNIRDYVHECNLQAAPRGKLWIMPAGTKDGSYNNCRMKIDWVRLYESGLGEPFIENWKAAIANHFQPDYVLIDSRTGLTDVGGICTLHLPDLVVLLFGLNEQNIRGVAAVAKAVRESEFTKVPQLHFVASPVPNLPRETNGALVQRLEKAAAELGTKTESLIHYTSIAALNEKLFVLDENLDTSTLVGDYRQLLNALIKYNRNGIDFLLEQAQAAIKVADTQMIQRLLGVFESEFTDRSEGLMACAELQRALGNFDTANELAERAFRTDPTLKPAFDWLYNKYKRDKNYAAALELCQSASVNSEKAPLLTRIRLETMRGQTAMALQQFDTAVTAYDSCLELLKQRIGSLELSKERGSKLDPQIIMASIFNSLESARRATKNPIVEGWPNVISFFDRTGEMSAAPSILQANRWQAMHIAFALSGNIQRAREALVKARQAAELLGPAEDIFSVKTYTDVTVDQFLRDTDEMIAALEKGQLWDGMRLPEAKSELKESPKLSQAT